MSFINFNVYFLTC